MVTTNPNYSTNGSSRTGNILCNPNTRGVPIYGHTHPFPIYEHSPTSFCLAPQHFKIEIIKRKNNVNKIDFQLKHMQHNIITAQQTTCTLSHKKLQNRFIDALLEKVAFLVCPGQPPDLTAAFTSAKVTETCGYRQKISPSSYLT